MLLILCLLFCVAAPTGAEAAASVIFISVNETLLELSSQPYTRSGITYAPYWIFSSLGINYGFFNDGQTVSIYTSSKQLTFELDTGSTYDDAGNVYSTQAIYRGGEVYLPVSFMCAYFGLSWSYITGEGYGDILRIKDSSVVLSDSKFLSAASSLMQMRYEEWLLAHPPEPSPTPPPTPSPTPDRQATNVYLGFTGSPTKELLDHLSDKELSVCFFLTEEDVAENADLIRRAAGEGHTLGVLLGSAPQRDYGDVSGLIFEAASVLPLIVSSSAENEAACREFASATGLAYWSFSVDSSALSIGSAILAIEDSLERSDVSFACGTWEDTLPDLADYLIRNRYSLSPTRETDAPEAPFVPVE